jgi:hypothetical protein
MVCHSRENGNPGLVGISWMPAYNCGYDDLGSLVHLLPDTKLSKDLIQNIFVGYDTDYFTKILQGHS